MRIYVLPCDGIGPEIIDASMISLEAVNKKYEVRLTFDFDEIGFAAAGRKRRRPALSLDQPRRERDLKFWRTAVNGCK